MSKVPPNFTGNWKQLNPADLMRYEQEYRDGIKHGKYCHINTSTNVVCRQGSYVDGLEHGTAIVRNSGGKVLATYEFVTGTGVHQIFTSADRLGWEVPYRNGLLHGTKRRYELGKLVEEIKYIDGKTV